MTALSDLAWPRTTARLSIRPGVEADLEPLFRIRTRPEVEQWMTDAPPDLDWFLRRSAEVDRLASTLVIERDGRMVGDLMLRVEDAWGQHEVAADARGTQAEIGWCLDPAETGRGYATEAVEELLRIAFSGLGLRRVTALCFAANDPSWRLMERVGMRRETHAVRDSLHRTGGWMDGYGYALLAEEWAAAAGASRGPGTVTG
jgi:RimJ/RimL family protein N-acetyltransferase